MQLLSNFISCRQLDEVPSFYLTLKSMIEKGVRLQRKLSKKGIVVECVFSMLNFNALSICGIVDLLFLKRITYFATLRTYDRRWETAPSHHPPVHVRARLFFSQKTYHYLIVPKSFFINILVAFETTHFVSSFDRFLERFVACVLCLSTVN